MAIKGTLPKLMRYFNKLELNRKQLDVLMSEIINMYGKVAIIDNCSFVYSQQLLSFDKEFEMIQKLNITNCQNWSNLLFQQFNAQSFLSNKIFSGFIPSNGKLKITLDSNVNVIIVNMNLKVLKILQLNKNVKILKMF